MKSLSEEESKLGLASTSKFMSKKPILDFRIAKIRFEDNGERVERGSKLEFWNVGFYSLFSEGVCVCDLDLHLHL